MIYFVQPEEGGLVKIGVAEDPARRLAAMQACSPLPLRLLATMPGDQEIERHVHLRFYSWREHGEWFRPSVRLKRFIEREGTVLAPIRVHRRKAVK